MKLVLHMGSTRPEKRSAPPLLDETSGLVTWVSDIREVLTFADLEAVETQGPLVRDVLLRWLAIQA